MMCPECRDITMVEMDDNGGGWRGHECPACGCQVLNADQPCPKGQEGEPCYFVDNEFGTGRECLMCGRDDDS